jgi:hypothetical protein
LAYIIVIYSETFELSKNDVTLVAVALQTLVDQIPSCQIMPMAFLLISVFLANRLMISFELKSEEGDLYHTTPSVKVALPQNSVKLRSRLKDSTLDLLVQTDFQYPRHILRLVVNTGIRDGRLIHHLWKDALAERKLNTLYAFNDFFEYKDQNGNGLRFYSDDCFDYEVKDDGDVYLTLVRSVQILITAMQDQQYHAQRLLILENTGLKYHSFLSGRKDYQFKILVPQFLKKVR